MRGVKEFWPIYSQPHPPPFLIVPPLLVNVKATINEHKKERSHSLLLTPLQHHYLQQN